MGIYLVMINNLRRSWHHKLLFAVTFLLPVLLCLLLGMVKFDKPSIRVGILLPARKEIKVSDMDKLYPLLDSSIGVEYREAKEDRINTDLMSGRFHMIMDYRESITIDHFEVLSYQSEDKIALIKDALHGAITKREPVSLIGLNKEGLSVTERSVAILLTLFMVFSSIYTSAIIRDRKSGILTRFQFARKSSISYILGYMLYNFIITYCQVLLCNGVLMAVEKDYNPGLAGGILISIVIPSLATVFSMLICLISHSEVQANITASALAAVMSLLGGVFVAVEAMPGLLRILSFTSPVRWVVELMGILR